MSGKIVLTDEKLIEIWEICNSPLACQKCPLNNTSCAKILHNATLKALKNLVQLVELQKEENFVLEARLEGSQGANEILKAEIEAQCKAVKYYQKKATEIKAEAIKEFADRLKENNEFKYSTGVVFSRNIDNLVKEMAGDAK